MALVMSGWKVLTLDNHVVHPPTQLSLLGEGFPDLASVYTATPALPPDSPFPSPERSLSIALTPFCF